MDIEIHIEELVLYGLPAADKHVIGEAVSAELARLIAEQGAPGLFTQSLNLPYLQSGNIGLVPGLRPAAVGTQIAQSLYQSLDHEHPGG